MRRILLIAALAVAFSFIVAGCSNNCEPVFKDYHVWQVPPKDADAAKDALGKFCTGDCDGVRPEWVWFKPQDENIKCRDYSGASAVNRLIGKGIGAKVASVIKEETGVGIDYDQDDFSRMKIKLMEECGIQRSATNLKANPAVCEKGGDRDGDFEPWWYVRRVYRLNWHNSVKLDATDIAMINTNAEKVLAMLPNLKMDAGPDAQSKGVLVMDLEDAWAAWRAAELPEGYCFHYAVHK